MLWVVIDEGIELCFIAWELDEFAEPSIILYHVKLSIEGIPHHAWNQEVVEKVLCDEAIIHHVEEGTGKRLMFARFRAGLLVKTHPRSLKLFSSL
jgi:hypothetical protein